MKPSLFVCLLSIFTILYSIHCENNFNDINADYDDDEDNSDSDESTNLFGGPKSSLEKVNYYQRIIFVYCFYLF